VFQSQGWLITTLDLEIAGAPYHFENRIRVVRGATTGTPLASTGAPPN
jgi:hypothetical protein